jgi:hypothetical protein
MPRRTWSKARRNAPAVVGHPRIIAQDDLDFPAGNARAVLLHIEAGTRFDLPAGRREGPVIGRMRPTLMVSSAAALTQANAMNTPAVNLQHIGLSSQAHPVGAMISHRHGARRAQAPRPTLVFQPGASLSGRLTRSIPPSS